MPLKESPKPLVNPRRLPFRKIARAAEGNPPSALRLGSLVGLGHHLDEVVLAFAVFGGGLGFGALG